MHSSTRPLPLLGMLAVIVAVGLAGPPVATARDCRNADLDPSAARAGAIERATLCLINHERRARGLGPLRREPRLSRAAQRHSDDMTRRDYFAHVAPGGLDLRGRLTNAGYLRGAGSWSAGENIAWGSGWRARPAAIVASWMASPGHRANILSADYRQIGLGVTPGVPQPGVADGATYTTDFGTRD